MRRTALLCCLLTCLGAGLACGQPAAYVGLATGEGLHLLHGGDPVLSLSYPLWGPGWAWTGWQGSATEEGGETVHLLKATIAASRAQLQLRLQPRQTGPRQITLDYTLTASAATPLTLATVCLSPRGAFAGASTLVQNAGETVERTAPYGRQPLGTAVSRLTLTGADGRRLLLAFSPAPEIQADGDARIVLARDSLAADTPVRLRITIDLPELVTFYASPGAVPDDPAMSGWYPFAPAAELPASSELGLEDWLPAPAGAQGRIRREGETLLVGGRPGKLWGLNLCYGACAPEKDLAERRARFYARYGVNAVRLHKYADGPGWAGIQAPGSCVEFDPAALDRMDYFIATLKAHGLYVEFSPTFGILQPGPADAAAVPYLAEFGSLKGETGRVNTGHGSLYFSPELQALQIRQMVNLLRHRNPYTGLTYAEDPCLAAVEIVNEHSALFYSSLAALRQYPTLRRLAAAKFSAWLRARYGDEAGLVKAWGPEGLNALAGEGFSGESLAAGTVVPAGNPWFFDPDQLAGSQKPRRQRLLDTMRFLYELQNEFYASYVKAVREAGYAGEIVASNWQAGRGASHFLNLHSDYQVGLIDRHNYVGGQADGVVDNATMLAQPGSGLLSSGLQQIADRPFMLSEWIHCFPNEWGAEGPAILGAYGLGLQGWDASFMFQNRDSGGFSDRIGRDTWDVTAPQVFALCPAVARALYRGDVREAKATVPLRVDLPSLFEGTLGFSDRTEQGYDAKLFSTDKVPLAALAASRVAVEYTATPEQTPAFAAPAAGQPVVSDTGQLRWTPGRTRLDGHFTIDTPGTKAVVGFAAGQRCDLGEVTITPQTRFCAVYVTAAEREATVASGKRLLITALARARNTGMKWLEDRLLLERGQGPVLLEPVRAEITLRRQGGFRVIALDHDGCRTATEVPVQDGVFALDGAKYKTPYYEVLLP